MGSNSVVNIISSFSEKNSVPVYTHIMLAFIGAIVSAIALNLSFNLLPILPWDNTTSTSNAIIDNLNLLSMSIFHSRVALNLQDLAYY